MKSLHWILMVLSCAVSRVDGAPRQAEFEVRHELKVAIPEGARRVRVWFAMPQEDPNQAVKDFQVESPVPHRVTVDSEGNTAVYLELDEPKLKQFSVIETFSLARREQVSGVNPRKALRLLGAVADVFAGGFKLNAENEALVRLTTGDGYTGGDPAKVDYYFGNIDERRVTWSRGRDLVLSPRQEGEPINALAKAYVEVDGKPAAEKEVWTRKLTFKEIK